MVLLTAAIFLGPLAGEIQEVPWSNAFRLVGKNSLGRARSDVLFSPKVRVICQSPSTAVGQRREGIL